MPDYDGTNVCRSSQSIRPPTTKVITTAISGFAHYNISYFCLVFIFKMPFKRFIFSPSLFSRILVIASQSPEDC